ncbi:hypothetical protein PV327_010894 [Microctonus hyperodae]|uniref:Uncharacterized protein n=1 Tax=Microctonus hyperodae TaxID=165561 RepID=A0AA39C8S3_MICHY|nr:hypothetical protein PV327_010894 [Microctonus hyperodae]
MIIINEETNAELANVHLKLTKRSLANENLPIWIMNGPINTHDLSDKNRNDLIRDHEIMKNVGEFWTYQEPETSSALVYFHERREFYGMIDTTITIKGLEVKFINPTSETRVKLNTHGVTNNPYHVDHSSVKTNNNNPHDKIGVNSASNVLRTYQSHVYDGYPEILVVVTWNMVEYIIAGATCTETDLHTSIVAYVITLFNGVDMLFSKFHETKIQINIAGIIIGKEKESFSFLDECLTDITDSNGSITKKLIGTCAMSRFKLFLRGRGRQISRESYDMIVLLTGNDIIDVINPTNQDMNVPNQRAFKGLADMQKNLYEERRKSLNNNIAAIVNGKGYFESYPSIAHELGHTSPNCCAFINKPGSLLPPGRYQMLTADEQCQCYGFASTKKFTEIPDNFCKSQLQCKTENGDDEFVDTIIPMYGTPCQSNKVCSKNDCQTIEIFGYSDSGN